MALDPRTLAPIISLAATWGVRKILTGAYEKKTGEEPPSRDNLSTPLGTVLLWAGITALATTLIDVAIQRGAAAIAEKREIGTDGHAV